MAGPYEPEFPGGGAARAREPVPPPVSERSIADIVKDIVANVQEIIRSEVRLATVEMREKALQAGKAGILLAAGGIVALYAVAFVLVSIYNAISTALWPWLSALILGVVLGIAAAGMISAGRKRMKRLSPKPETTIQTVKEDIEWLKNQTR